MCVCVWYADPFGDAKPRELVLKSKNEVDQYAEVAPTQEEIDKLLNPPAEKRMCVGRARPLSHSSHLILCCLYVVMCV